MKKILLKVLLPLFMFFTMIHDGIGQTYTNTTKNLVTTDSPQTITGAWVDAGTEIAIGGFTRMAICTQLDINSTTDFRIRVQYKIASGGTKYDSMILSPGASSVKIEPEYYELNVDADGNYCFDVSLIGMNYVQVQIMAGTAGSPAGRVLAMYANLSNK
jgi:hypothetical protein